MRSTKMKEILVLAYLVPFLPSFSVLFFVLYSILLMADISLVFCPNGAVIIVKKRIKYKLWIVWIFLKLRLHRLNSCILSSSSKTTQVAISFSIGARKLLLYDRRSKPNRLESNLSRRYY